MIYLQLFAVFFKLGMFSFGGGYAILSMIYQDIQGFGLISPADFSNIVALSQVTPGPIAVNAATFIGYKSGGIIGATVATIGVALPAFFIILTISLFLKKFQSSPVVQAILSGIRPATVGMISAAVIFFSNTSILKEGFFSLAMLGNPLSYVSLPSVLIFALCILASVKLKIDPITVTVLAGILGIFLM